MLCVQVWECSMDPVNKPCKESQEVLPCTFPTGIVTVTATVTATATVTITVV